MAAECKLRLSLVDQPLFDSTVREYVREFENAVERCYDCDGDPCEKHRALWQQRVEDAQALAFGMLRIEVE